LIESAFLSLVRSSLASTLLSKFGRLQISNADIGLGPVDTNWRLLISTVGRQNASDIKFSKKSRCKSLRAPRIASDSDRLFHNDNMEALVFHMHIRYRSRDGGGSCDAAREYLAREGSYAKCGDKVRWVQSLHMPVWAGEGSAAIYWQAAEGRRSRVNARTALLIEFALPKNLTVTDQNALALRMAEQLARMGTESTTPSGRMPVTLSVHEGYGRNPHVHALVSTSITDGLTRTADSWFRRYMPQLPESGGARRSVYVTRRRWVHRVRQAWAAMANAALEMRGLAPTLDHRSHAERGLIMEPKIHLGPRIAQMAAQGIETIRGVRHAAIERRNADRAELDARILRRRQVLADLELRDSVALQAERVWAEMRNRDWSLILEEHPFAGSIGELRMHATAMIIESDAKNIEALHMAFRSNKDVRRFAEAVGPQWDPVSTKEGSWAVKPDQDSVVLLCPGYAATDADDEESMVAMIHAALTLPFARPALVVRDKPRAMAMEAVQRLGLDWPILQLKVSRLAPR
jgi:hypothetical protein